MRKTRIGMAGLILLSSLWSNAQQKTEKKKSVFKIKSAAALSIDRDFTSNQSVGFWGFSDPAVEKQSFHGYLFGIVMSLRMSEYIDLFMDINIARSKILMGKDNSYLRGMAVWDADPNHYSSASPILPYDIYYVSKATMGRMGMRFLYPVSRHVAPFIGIVGGIVPYEIAFADKKGARAYSEVVSNIATTYALLLGMDFTITSGEQEITTIGLFGEMGGAASESGTEMHNWLWQDWTYHAQFPVIPAFRVGLTVSF